jgi:hypothetical protein
MDGIAIEPNDAERLTIGLIEGDKGDRMPAIEIR